MIMSRFGMHVRGVVAAALGVTMLLATVACGTTDDASPAGASRSSSTSGEMEGYDLGSVKKDPKIAALLPASVTKDGKFSVGVETTYAPAEFVAKDGKTAIGYDMDLARALAAVFGLKEESVSAPFDSIIPSIGSKFDAGLSGFTVTPERIKAVDFVSYFSTGSTLVVKHGNPQQVKPKELCGHSVGVQIGTVQEGSVNDANQRCKADGKPAIRVLAQKLQTDITTAVVTGKADAFYADTPVAGYAVKQTNNQLQTIGGNDDPVPEGIAIKKGDQGTVEAVRQAMQKLMDDGTYGKILEYWGVSVGAIKTAEINPKVA